MFKRIFPFFCVLVVVASCFFALPTSATELPDDVWEEIHEYDKKYNETFWNEDLIDELSILTSVKILPQSRDVIPSSTLDVFDSYCSISSQVFSSDLYCFERDTVYVFSLSGDEIFTPLIIYGDFFNPLDDPVNCRNIAFLLFFGDECVMYSHRWYDSPFYVMDDQHIAFHIPSEFTGIPDEADFYFSLFTFGEEYSSLSVTKLVDVQSPETSILSVFSSIAQSLIALFGVVIGLFYVSETGLTFFGVLAVAGLAFSVAFLLINKIKEWLNARN